MSSALRHLSLFRPSLLARSVAAHAFPADIETRHTVVKPWVDALAAGKLDTIKEVSFHGEFLTRVFGDALGYQGAAQAGAGSWELTAEKRMGAGGKSADGALGFFRHGAPGRVVAPIELKAAKQPLDHTHNRALTPVQQAWDYANHSPGCRWIVVSNYRETRLYSTSRTPDFYETIALTDLGDIAAFKRFYFLFARETLLPATEIDRDAPLDRLLVDSAREEEEITKKLYEEYRALRRMLFHELGRAHSNLPLDEVLQAAQTILDRFLFVAFAEDRGLLPPNTIVETQAYRDKFNPRPVWHNFQAIFRWIDEGNPKDGFPAYNGGLFQRSNVLDLIEVSDTMCAELSKFASYNFREDVSVEVLGHIFEQSITDLEELRKRNGDSLPPPPDDEKAVTPKKRAQPGSSKRHDEGIHYTPAYITRFIVERTLGRVFDERWKAVLAEKRPDERKAKEQTAAWIETWEAYREMLKSIRVLDPSCGSGAFLVAAYDALSREYERVNAALAELRGGQAGLFDLTKTVLNNNLFGVDLNAESVEITRLSLWLKTAERGKRLTYLDSNIKWGDSIVKDPDLRRVAFDWAAGKMARSFLDPPTAPEAVEIEAHWREGFDVVIGNPPYIRQELLGEIKEHLSTSYAIYHGMADIFVYFFERGLNVLKPGARLGFIVSNKWIRSEYGERLRLMLARQTRMETLVDFGHAPIFPDADTFPCIITLQKPGAGEVPAASPDHTLSVTSFPRELLEHVSIPEYFGSHRYEIVQARLGGQAWNLERAETGALFDKIREQRLTLTEYAGAKPYRGLVTGFNEAFLVDTDTKNRLVTEDARSPEILKKYFRGQDIGRWAPEWDGTWMIFARRGIDIDSFPAIKQHLLQFRDRLEPRPVNWSGSEWPGRKPGSYKWFELQDPAEYWELFASKKIVYQVIQFHSAYALDDVGFVLNDKGFFIPSTDSWLLAVLNSPLMWWHNWRYLTHMKDEALTPLGVKMEQLPIAKPTDEARAEAERIVPKLVQFVKQNNEARAAVLDLLRMQYDVSDPGQKLKDFASLSSNDFIAEVVKRRPKSAKKLKAADLKALRETYDEEALPIQARRREAKLLERCLSDLVNQAYDLMPEEIELMWSTAPPRMPGRR